jgi:hypothetical protein
MSSVVRYPTCRVEVESFSGLGLLLLLPSDESD